MTVKSRIETCSMWRFWIDRGGTFTDCIGVSPEGETHVMKVLSSDEAPLTGIRSILGIDGSASIPPCEVKMGTTVATNALLERKGREHTLLITKGFSDALEIGTQQRSKLFDLRIKKPSLLYSRVIEIEERISAHGDILQPLDEDSVREQLIDLQNEGVENLAIVFLHAFAFPQHEIRLAEMAREVGYTHVSSSHEVCPEIGFTSRGDTTVADAYLTPLLVDYLNHLKRELPGSILKMMQSSGGLIEAERFRGHNSILSGPAAGVVACARVGERFGISRVVGFDMGGTSTDVSRYDGGFERVYETETAGVRIKAPMIRIHTVAAGGGSLCRFHGGRLQSGPESAGSDPGPLSYGLVDDRGKLRATDLTVTDVNLFLGRILPENFPFDLKPDRVDQRIQAISERCREDGENLTPEEVAEGFLQITNLNMAQAIKEISVMRGHDVREDLLCCFGGAGGQHACAVARQLGIQKILIHPFAGVLSAYGMGVADTVWEGSSPVSQVPLTRSNLASLNTQFEELVIQGTNLIESEGFSLDSIGVQRKLDLRYVGTETPITLVEPENGEYEQPFAEMHHQLYGYVREGRPIEILQCRVEVTGKTTDDPTIFKQSKDQDRRTGEGVKYSRVYFSGEFHDARVIERSNLIPGESIAGPTLILESIGTIWLEPGFDAILDENGNLFIIWNQSDEDRPSFSTESDPVSLEVFNNLFMSVAEQMGNVLRRTSVSTNIKERLDFSCAIFDQQGRLVANAPHIPVHLGAMGETVRAVLESHPRMQKGDVYVSNNPFRGGSHLPDITVVTPVFYSGTKPAFYVASRAHHADVGGITPGSIPSFSTSIEEEGILLDNVRLVTKGVFEEEIFRNLFSSGEHPARNLTDNLADLQAQIASNRAGVRLLEEMVERYSEDVVQSYMGHVRENASRQVREALLRIPDGTLTFEDSLDDGNPIRVSIQVDGDQAIVDFTDSGNEDPGNLNAPRAVVHSAVLYVFRCLVGEDIPLNEGCLNPIEIIVPERSLLDPSAGRAVVGGNVETSQRVVDVLLGAMGIAAASQGTMNNITFGDENFGYYETLAGGVGACEGYSGASAVHTHMTNTRVTDPEILETRHPVRLDQFTIRRGSGGGGQYQGGDGLIRQYRFLKALDVSILSQRRTVSPFGLFGGKGGQTGKNTWVLKNGQIKVLGPLCSFQAAEGDQLRIETPGGGGFGQDLD